MLVLFRLIKWISAFFIVGLVVSVWAMWRFEYRRDYYRIQSALNELPGVQIVDMGGQFDIVMEEIWVLLKKDGKGPIRICNIIENGQMTSGVLDVARVGDWRFKKTICNSKGKSVVFSDKAIIRLSGPNSDKDSIAMRLGIMTFGLPELFEKYDVIEKTLAEINLNGPVIFPEEDGWLELSVLKVTKKSEHEW